MSKKAMGIRNAYYAPLTISTDASGNDTYTFAKPIRIPDLEEVSVTETYAEGSNYADNICNISIKVVNNADISMTFSNVQREVEAAFAGKNYKNGMMESTVDDVQKSCALLYQKTFDDGSYENIVYYNCRLSRDDNGGSTKGESISFQSVTISGTAIPLSNGKLSLTIASDEVGDDATATTALQNFFTTVQFLK